MYQIISKLMETGTKPKNILYLNFDDPGLTNLEEHPDFFLGWNSKR